VPDATSSAILSALKYDGWPAVADEMGRRLARLGWPEDVRAERSAVVPVPLAPVKERARGFNQAERIGAAVAKEWRMPLWNDVLRRTRATPSQTRLTPGERLANVHGAFLADDAASERIRGTHLVLVDDVLTTGATLNACAHALFAAGARTISYLTFGRARTSADR
jgi:ComF family protein